MASYVVPKNFNFSGLHLPIAHLEKTLPDVARAAATLDRASTKPDGFVDKSEFDQLDHASQVRYMREVENLLHSKHHGIRAAALTAAGVGVAAAAAVAVPVIGFVAALPIVVGGVMGPGLGIAEVSEIGGGEAKRSAKDWLNANAGSENSA